MVCLCSMKRSLDRIRRSRGCIRTVTELQGRKLGLVPVRDAGFEACGTIPSSKDSGEACARGAANAGCACRVSPRRSEVDPGRNGLRSKTRPVLYWQRRAKENRANRKGEVKDFSKPEDNLDCVLGLFVDVAREQLYAVSTNGFLDEAQSSGETLSFATI